MDLLLPAAVLAGVIGLIVALALLNAPRDGHAAGASLDEEDEDSGVPEPERD